MILNGSFQTASRSGSLVGGEGYVMDGKVLSLADRKEAMKPDMALTFYITTPIVQFRPSAAAMSVIL